MLRENRLSDSQTLWLKPSYSAHYR
uniref:Uncharacterized protein n=1 Tax=Anguilla anguilla TaxID=7936 RepID=A0A0E9X970_ANGAN